MPSITFRFADGRAEREVAFEPGQSVMQAAVNNDIPGVVGECGGEMSCATCHVYVDAEWTGRIRSMSNAEEEIVEVVERPEPNSRLGCQVRLSDVQDGIVVTVPEA